ncbi:MAG: DUF86 domain-containing protein [Thermoanaerobaculales bacterium]|nr:DUF86 domain-containing protein [Thermoanaerobaculales bacterium]
MAKLNVISEMLSGVQSLPLASEGEFTRDPRMVAAGESYLRRALEGLLDLGRHVLAKGFGLPVAEYAAIADQLGAEGVISRDVAAKLKLMAGYRNRLVHEYDVVLPGELYAILTGRISDVVAVSDAIRSWLAEHPERVDRSL